MARKTVLPEGETRARGRGWRQVWRSAGRRLPAREQCRHWLPPLVLGLLLGVTGALAIAQLRGAEKPPVFILPPGPLDTSPDVTITFSPGLLTALVQQSIARGESPVPLENVRIETHNGVLAVRGNVTVLRRAVGGVITLEPVVEDGRLRMRVLQARLGGLPVPNDVERVVEKPINAQLAAAIGGLPATVTSARTARDGLTVTARVHVDELNLHKSADKTRNRPGATQQSPQ